MKNPSGKGNDISKKEIALGLSKPSFHVFLMLNSGLMLVKSYI